MRLAYVWFSMAVDQRIRSRDKLKRTMTTAQAEAERQFRERLNRLLEQPVRVQGIKIRAKCGGLNL